MCVWKCKFSSAISQLNFSSPKKFVKSMQFSIRSTKLHTPFKIHLFIIQDSILVKFSFTYFKRKPDFLTKPYWPYFLQNAIVISRCVTFSSPFFLLLPNLFDTEKSVSPSQNVSSTYYSCCYVLFSSFFSYSRSDVGRLQTKVTQT